MPRGDSSLNMLIVAAILALGVGYYVPQTFSAKPAIESVKSSGDGVKADSSAKPKAAAKSGWATSAAGRVEPIGGEVRIGAQLPGRVAEVLVALNDKVAAGDLLARLDDEELIGRANAALAEATVRKRERDNAESSAGKLAQDRRSAEDAVANSERQLVQNRDEFDRTYKARRSGQEADVEKARDAVNKSKERLEPTRGKLRTGQAAIVRSDAFPGKDFDGKIATLGQALGPSRLGQRGPRKPTDVDVLEVIIDLAGQPPLLAGMRVDVFLKPDTTASAPQQVN